MSADLSIAAIDKTFEKLTGPKNYPSWSRRIGIPMGVRGYSDNITKDMTARRPSPAAVADGTTYAPSSEELATDAKAKALLAFYVGDAYTNDVLEASSCYAAMQKIKSRFQPYKQTYINEYRSGLARLRHAHGETISALYTRAQNMRDDIVTLGGTYTLQELAQDVLQALALEPDYIHVASTLSMQLATVTAFEMANLDSHRAQMESHEAALAARAADKRENAMLARAYFTGARGGRGSRGRGWGGGRGGAPARSMGSAQFGRGNYSNSQPRRNQCHYCGKLGHWDNEWRTKQSDLAKGIVRNSTSKPGSDGKGYVLQLSAFAGPLPAGAVDALAAGARGRDIFFIDSGCERHIINDPELFTEFWELDETVTIQYGNGTATSFVEGTVFIPNGAGGTLRLDNVLFDKQCPANLLSLATTTSATTTTSASLPSPAPPSQRATPREASLPSCPRLTSLCLPITTTP